ncbi:MAG: SDR family oxidoreductase [bacterium]|nr:SDR family oxidoreductase [bacterium]
MTEQKRLIVLTGVTRGLGRALLTRFDECGHTVLGCGRSVATIAELKPLFPQPHDLATVDVADTLAVAAWADRLLAEHGAPDLVINNAGVINANASLWEVSAAEFAEVVDVNIKGVANVIRAFAPALIGRATGVIANLSSGWGRSVSPEVAPYCATKWAVEGLTRALALELPRGLAAVAVNPGIIDTDMLRSCFGEGAAAYEGPDAWAETAAPFLLALNAADNGAALTVA